MLLINKNYFSSICGGARGRYSKLQRMAQSQRETQEKIFEKLKGLTVEEAHKACPFIPEKELCIMFKLDADNHIIAPRLSDNNVTSLAQALVDYDKTVGRRW